MFRFCGWLRCRNAASSCRCLRDANILASKFGDQFHGRDSSNPSNDVRVLANKYLFANEVPTYLQPFVLRTSCSTILRLG
mmetsp:Transcript_30898/g.82845  ORF Transcript_30898/g.82845 Transcript_30898/m.82845 type:complete len:80 (-) Transcript_30898:4-243(-)